MLPLNAGSGADAERDGKRAKSRRPTARRDLDESRAANVAAADRLRRERYERWGIDPDAPDAEAQWFAESERRNRLVQEGWTFIRGRQERMEDWARARHAQAMKAEEQKRAEAEARLREQPQPSAGDPERDWM